MTRSGRSHLRRPPEERLMEKIEVVPNDCWVFTGRLSNGYARIWKNVLAHRFMYEFILGEKPGETLDHLCRVRHCCNPFHLEKVSSRENVLRGEGTSAVNARKTHCLNGHELSGDNVYLQIRESGFHSRSCRACHASRQREYMTKKKREGLNGC